MKKFFTFLFLFLISSSIVFAADFPDVSSDNEHFVAIKYLVDKGIINGYIDGTFKPDGLVNRAEATKIIVKAFNIPYDKVFEESFPDVKKSDWFFPFVMASKEEGLLSGYKDGKFKPENNINLAETLKIIEVAGNAKIPEKVESNVFLDTSKDDWYAVYALYARDHNIVLSDDYGNLHAEQPMTRQAFSEVVYRMMIVSEKNGESFPLYTNWATFTGKYLPFQIKYDDNTWQAIENKSEVIFYRADKEFLQFSPAKIYPNSGRLWVTLDKNDANMTSSQYFENLKLAFPGAEYTEFKLHGLSAMEVLYPKSRTVDWYVYLDSGKVFVVYTEFGGGVLGFKLQQYLKAMLSTFEYKDLALDSQIDYTEVLNEIYSKILVEGKGMNALNQLPEKTIIETDSIGVGTGPVDYYYSSGVNKTFKYERNSDTILDKRDGRTSAF
ncbi:S-layer homology domain-containing protein [Candidatus Gracilibacteria bacterium]|nr:S-layer homology domain-containing protein [Candidatus Gracilibacteria bacterium]